jgi:hypothetical protein
VDVPVAKTAARPAKAIVLTVPPIMLSRADEVIE